MHESGHRPARPSVNEIFIRNSDDYTGFSYKKFFLKYRGAIIRLEPCLLRHGAKQREFAEKT
jgi:hypothetical protein